MQTTSAGTTSLGNGTIDGFMLVLRDAFDCDYDTEIYVKLNTFGAQIYTDGYDNQIDEAEEWLEDFAQEQADERYSRLKSEAERDLFEGREQLTAQTQSGELELIASKDQLDSAKVEIDSGYAQLESGRTELQSGQGPAGKPAPEPAEPEDRAAAAKTAGAVGTKRGRRSQGADGGHRLLFPVGGAGAGAAGFPEPD